MTITKNSHAFIPLLDQRGSSFRATETDDHRCSGSVANLVDPYSSSSLSPPSSPPPSPHSMSAKLQTQFKKERLFGSFRGISAGKLPKVLGRSASLDSISSAATLLEPSQPQKEEGKLKKWISKKLMFPILLQQRSNNNDVKKLLKEIEKKGEPTSSEKIGKNDVATVLNAIKLVSSNKVKSESIDKLILILSQARINGGDEKFNNILKEIAALSKKYITNPIVKLSSALTLLLNPDDPDKSKFYYEKIIEINKKHIDIKKQGFVIENLMRSAVGNKHIKIFCDILLEAVNKLSDENVLTATLNQACNSLRDIVESENSSETSSLQQQILDKILSKAESISYINRFNIFSILSKIAKNMHDISSTLTKIEPEIETMLAHLNLTDKKSEENLRKNIAEAKDYMKKAKEIDIGQTSS